MYLGASGSLCRALHRPQSDRRRIVKTHLGARPIIEKGIGTMVAGTFLALAGLAATPASASTGDADPVPYDGNLDCADIGYPVQYKIDEQPSNGAFGPITISNVELVDGRLEFDWSSGSAWDVVLVKQADGGLRYDYAPARTSDQDVQTVAGKNSGGISHVTFCAAPPAEETPPAVVDVPTTVATAPTPDAQVLGVVVTKAPAPPAAQVVGSQTLPITGRSTLPLAAVGTGLVMVGAGAVRISTRRARAC
jgi:hypothetical protein